MNLKAITSYIAVVLLLALSSCDYIDGPKTVGIEPLPSDSTRKVLLEEYSGHRCPNCPPSHRESKKLDSLFGDDLIIVTIHASGFATPVPSLGYPADYRTDLGDAMELNYGASLTIGYPAGMINRAEFSGEQLHKYTTWGQHAATVLSSTAALKLDMDVDYNASSRQASITVDMEYYQDAADNHQLMLIVTEDSLISAQLDGFNQVNDYVHRHVLRDNITSGFWGVPVSGATISQGDTFQQQFTYTLDPAWNDKQCSIIAYVLDGDTYEIYQAEEVHIDYQ